MRKWVFLCLLFLPFLSSAAEREIRIGLIDTFDQDFYLETFVPTIEHIQKTLKDYKITVVELQQNNLLANVVKERPDFLVSSAGNFVTLISKLGAQQIATVSRNHAYSPKEAVSSVFIVRNDRKDLQKITDHLAIYQSGREGIKMVLEHYKNTYPDLNYTICRMDNDCMKGENA